MPHITVEYSANLEPELDIRHAIEVVHEAAVRSGIFELGGIRTRASCREHFRIADGDPSNGFVHIEARIAPGRPLEKRKALGEAIFNAASKLLDPVFARRPIALSVGVEEMAADELRFKRNNLHAKLAAKTARGDAA
jgi:5-carboxymethyl-2-hydroxymuconate isomerase